MAPLHERMPVILDPADYELWLDPAAPPEAAEALLGPAPDGDLEAVAVNPRVNNVRFDDPDCIKPVDDVPPLI